MMHGGSIFGITAAGRTFGVLVSNIGKRFSTRELEDAAEVKAGSTRVSEVRHEIERRHLPYTIKVTGEARRRSDGGRTVVYYYALHHTREEERNAR